MSPYLDNGLPSMSPKDTMIPKLFYFPVLPNLQPNLAKARPPRYPHKIWGKKKH
jgi:hypothetical protein